MTKFAFFAILAVVVFSILLWFGVPAFFLIERGNYCQQDEDCIVFIDLPFTSCGKGINVKEKQKVEGLINFTKQINPNFARRLSARCESLYTKCENRKCVLKKM